MSAASHSSLDKLLGRLDDLDATNLTILVERLARERSLLEAVFNTMLEGILVIRRNGRIEYANASAGKLVGIKQRENAETTLWKLVPDLARSLDLSKEGKFSTATTITRELELNYPEFRFVRLYIVPFNETKETDIVNNERFVVIISDITREKKLTQEQIEGERVSSIFMLAAGVAHELGNPLNSLTIHLQLIRRQLAKIPEGIARDKVTKSIEICETEVSRLDGIITNFLEALRPTEPDFQNVDLIAELESALEFMHDELANSGIRVDIQIDETPPVVLADRNQVRQVYFNIIKNAREAMSPGGTIKVRARTDDEFVYIALGDTGTGIDHEELAKVFQPYFTTKKTGNGLGMMIVQRIMRDHGGQIGIDSKRGVGTVVTLQFPQQHRKVRLLENRG